LKSYEILYSKADAKVFSVITYLYIMQTSSE
jgi:hypothetical protein